jgi:photosystem II stability/assembly factor-like uncharacterized protein
MKRFKQLFSLSMCMLVMLAAQGQTFMKTPGAARPVSFKEMQKRFDEWSKTKDLKKTRGWKYYKRWESDMALKTNGTGELADPAIYINEAIRIADQRKGMKAGAKFAASTWSPVGPYVLPGNLTGYMQNGIGRINCIAFHPTNPNTYFVGVAQGGMWKTTNNGASWTPLTDNLPITRISDISIDPSNPNTMYISVCDFEYIDVALNLDGRKRNTHYGLGVYKTTDGGLNWSPTGLSFQLTDGDASLIRKVIVNPANSNMLVAAGVTGVYTSANAGASWTKTLDSLMWDLQEDPTVPNTLFAASGWLASSNTGAAGIYKSTNFGATWTACAAGVPSTGAVQRIRVAIAPSDHNYIYAFAVDDMEGMYGIYKSTDNGSTWTYINPGVNVLSYDDGFAAGGQGTYDLGFSVNATNRDIVYVGGVNVWASTDGCNSFEPASHWTLSYGPTLHGDIHFIETQPSTGNVFVCSDGGLYRTNAITTQSWSSAMSGSPWPTTWTTISDGMAITSFYRLSSSRNTTGRISAGAQDNATFYYDGTAWNTIFGGDGMDNYLDPLDDNVVIGSAQYGNFFVSTDNGNSYFDPGINTMGDAGEWVSPIIADYNNPGTLYIGFSSYISASADGGGSWSALGPLPSNGIYDNEMSALAVANTNPAVIYAARRMRFEYGSPAGAYRTTNGGASWTEITSNLPDTLYYTSMDVSQTDANTAYVALAGLTAGEKVYRTTNGGSTWQNISYNLPNAPVNCIKTAPGTNALIVATDFGVYKFDATLNTWNDMSSGLPNVITTDLDFNSALNKVYVSTFGRGIWEIDMNALLGVGISEQENSALISLYPSPNDGSFAISLQEKMSKQAYDLNIVDVTGRNVYSKKLAGQSEYKISTNLPPGVYFAKISGDKVYGVKSFVIE